MAGDRHRAVQHRSAAPGVEAVSIRSDRSFPRHAHDQFGIGLLAFGGHRSWSGIGAVEAGPGDCIMVNPGEIHDGLAVAGVRGWRMLYLDPGLVADARGSAAGGAAVVRPAARDPELAAAVARAFAAVTAERPDPLGVEEAVLVAVAGVVGRHALGPTPRRERSPGVAWALRRLDEAPERPATLAELAALAGTSRFALLRGFKREVGATPHAYLVQRRLGVARRLLAAGRRPAEAAVEAGFADQSHLTRAFRRQFGVTPGQYRTAVG